MRTVENLVGRRPLAIEPPEPNEGVRAAALPLGFAFARDGPPNDAVGLPVAAREIPKAPFVVAQGEIRIGEPFAPQSGRFRQLGERRRQSEGKLRVTPIALAREHRAGSIAQARREHRRRPGGREAIPKLHQLARDRAQGGLEHDERASLLEQLRKRAQHRLSARKSLLVGGEELVEREAHHDQVGVAERLEVDGTLEIHAARVDAHRGDEPRSLGLTSERGEDVEGRRIALEGDDLDPLDARSSSQLRHPEARRAQARADVDDPPNGPGGKRTGGGELREGALDLRQIPKEKEAQTGCERVGGEPDRLTFAGVEFARAGHGRSERVAFPIGAPEEPWRKGVDQRDPLGSERSGIHGRHGGGRVITRATVVAARLAWPHPPIPMSVPRTRPPLGPLILAAITAILFVVTLWAIAFHAPVERTMGVVQKIFYFHVPSAYAMYIGFAVCGFGSAAYLVKRKGVWDALAVAGAEVGLVFCLIVLITGPLWARKAWGVWWTWDPRLTSTLLAAMIFTAYVVLRSFGSGETERRFAAGLAIIGLFNIPIIHYAVDVWRGQHPTVIREGGGGLTPEMGHTLLFAFAFFTALAVLLLWIRVRAERSRQALDALTLEAAERGLLEDA